MHYSIYAVGIVICSVLYYTLQRSRSQVVYRKWTSDSQLILEQATHLRIIQSQGCQPLRCLPNKWFPPFGLDKLAKVTEAEKTKSYPLLMLNEHEKLGDTYGQWGGPVYTIITRDIDNIRTMLARQFQGRRPMCARR